MRCFSMNMEFLISDAEEILYARVRRAHVVRETLLRY